MKRGLSSTARLLGALLPSIALPLVASAQEGAPPEMPAPDASSEATTPAAPVQPSPDGVTEPPSEGVTPTEGAVAPAGEAANAAPTTPEAAPPAPSEPPAPLDTEGPPEPEWDPKLEPDVYWEGDSDDHNPGYVPGYGTYQTTGMNPNLPRAGAMAGGTTAPAGSDTWTEDWAFHFHGYMEATLRAAYGSRGPDVAPGQSETTWHSTPIVPGRFGDFEATQAVPGPWMQMNFTYGNPYVSATAIVAGFNQQSGASYYYPSSQLGLNDVYLTLRLPEMRGLRLKAYAGAFQDRYGAMAQYSEGNYGHSIVAYTRGTGVTVVGDFDLFGDVIGLFEVGAKGTLDKAPLGIEPNDANAYADSQNGAGYLAHAHFGVAAGVWDISAHWLGAFAKDDRVPTEPVRPGEPIPSERPDGSINTYGLTVRAIGEPFGHFFFGGGYTVARDARSVPRVINVLNADGGRGLMEEYLGMQSGGNGELTHVGLQYDMSLQKFLKYPAFFPSNAWDVRGSFFATFVHVRSDQASTNLPGFEVKFDDVNKFKVGTELTYNFVEWSGLSLRYDFVGPDLSDGERAFHIISPRILFRTNWLAHEQINIRYTHWSYGDRVIVQNVAPNDPQGLDEHMVALQANMYW